MAAPNFAMEPCLFTVQQRDDTRWHVFETGLPRSLASFGLKEDAIGYARDLARAWSEEIEHEILDLSEDASTEEARRIGARAAASLAAGAIKKPATSRA